MFCVEFHDSEVDNIAHGTIFARAGKNNGLEHEYQAEAWIQDMARKPLNRAYILRNGKPFAAWSYGKAATLQCVGHNPEYGGAIRLETPYLRADAMLLTAGRIGEEVEAMHEGEEWARSILVGKTATAILYDEIGIVSAWENLANSPLLVARGSAHQ